MEKDANFLNINANIWLNAFKILEERNDVLPNYNFRLYQILLFCFRVDVDRDLKYPCDQKTVKAVRYIVSLIPNTNTKNLIDILSDKRIPKPKEILKWKQMNIDAALKLEKSLNHI